MSKRERFRIGAVSALACIVLWIVVSARMLFGWLLFYNPTVSAPRGLYWLTPTHEVRVGDFALVCIPDRAARLAATRGYLAAGHCPGGAAPEMKHVAARAGDVVAIDTAGVTVNGRPLPWSRPLRADLSGRPLRGFADGTVVLGRDQVWLYSPIAIGYDSRYFGPVSTRFVRGTLRPLLVVK